MLLLLTLIQQTVSRPSFVFHNKHHAWFSILATGLKEGCAPENPIRHQFLLFLFLPFLDINGEFSVVAPIAPEPLTSVVPQLHPGCDFVSASLLLAFLSSLGCLCVLLPPHHLPEIEPLFSKMPDSASGAAEATRDDDAYSPTMEMVTVNSGDRSRYGPETALMNDSTQANTSSANKRKSPVDQDASQSSRSKRIRINQDGPVDFGNALGPRPDGAKQLPAEIWQHIFALLPPGALGRLLTVNKLFCSFLSPISTASPPSCLYTSSCVLQPLKPESIWQASRRLFWPRMPAPLKGKSELDMWRLTCSRSCQFCGNIGASKAPVESDEWHRGPGAKGVASVFPFSIVACGECLVRMSTKVCGLLVWSSRRF